MLNSIKWIFKWQKPNYVNTLQSVTVVEHIQVAKVFFFCFFIIPYVPDAVHVLTRWPCEKGDWMFRNVWHITGQNHQTQDEKFDLSKARSRTHSGCLCPGRLGLSLLVVSITDQHLRKAIGRTIMHSDFPPLLPLVIGEHGGLCPQLSGRWCFAGICGTENQAIYREHSSLRSSS